MEKIELPLAEFINLTIHLPSAPWYSQAQSDGLPPGRRCTFERGSSSVGATAVAASLYYIILYLGQCGGAGAPRLAQVRLHHHQFDVVETTRAAAGCRRSPPVAAGRRRSPHPQNLHDKLQHWFSIFSSLAIKTCIFLSSTNMRYDRRTCDYNI